MLCCFHFCGYLRIQLSFTLPVGADFAGYSPIIARTMARISSE